jgi:hypothetical protein
MIFDAIRGSCDQIGGEDGVTQWIDSQLCFDAEVEPRVPRTQTPRTMQLRSGLDIHDRAVGEPPELIDLG